MEEEEAVLVALLLGRYPEFQDIKDRLFSRLDRRPYSEALNWRGERIESDANEWVPEAISDRSLIPPKLSRYNHLPADLLQKALRMLSGLMGKPNPVAFQPESQLMRHGAYNPLTGTAPSDALPRLLNLAQCQSVQRKPIAKEGREKGRAHFFRHVRGTRPPQARTDLSVLWIVGEDTDGPFCPCLLLRL